MARAFVAIENDLPILRTAEEANIETDGEYHDKLKHLEGWLSEEESVKYWPMTLYPDSFNF